MSTSTILLNTPVVFQLSSDKVDSSGFKHCELTWEENKLIITQNFKETQIKIPALSNKTWLQKCLKHSPIKKVYLDPTMDKTTMMDWIDVCQAAQKQVYLRIPSLANLPQVKHPKLWKIKRVADWLLSLLLLLLLSPLILILSIGIWLDSASPVLFQQWQVGNQGQLFQIYKFRTMQADAEVRNHGLIDQQAGLHKLRYDPHVTRVGQGLRRLSLDGLPQLINVLKGDMSLVGPKSWAIDDAIRIESGLQEWLNAMPGIIGTERASSQANEVDRFSVACSDMTYIQHWSLFKDFRFLSMAIPKTLFRNSTHYNEEQS